MSLSFSCINTTKVISIIFDRFCVAKPAQTTQEEIKMDTFLSSELDEFFDAVETQPMFSTPTAIRSRPIATQSPSDFLPLPFSPPVHHDHANLRDGDSVDYDSVDDNPGVKDDLGVEDDPGKEDDPEEDSNHEDN